MKITYTNRSCIIQINYYIIRYLYKNIDIYSYIFILVVFSYVD